MLLALLVFSSAGPNLKPWMIGPFYREDSVNPVLRADPSVSFLDPMRNRRNAWRHDNVFNPAATVRDGKLVLLFRAEDASGTGIGHHTSRIGEAESSDGLHFKARPNPVLYPANDDQKQYDWPGGCEDPRVVKGPNGYLMTYTAWNGKTARLSIATSTDLVHWKKRGPAFAKADNGKWRDMWSKSGSIVTRIVGDSLVATKVDGIYWMYFSDKNVSVAVSTDLINWRPLTDTMGRILAVLRPRTGHFDSELCEAGPPAVLTDKGIVLIYNGANTTPHGDPMLPAGIYTAGQALFATKHPAE